MARLAYRRASVGAEIMIEAPFQHLAPNRLQLRIACAVAERSKCGLRRENRIFVTLRFPFSLRSVTSGPLRSIITTSRRP